MRISKQELDNRKHLAEFFGTGEHMLRAKIEELKDNNCPLFR